MLHRWGTTASREVHRSDRMCSRWNGEVVMKHGFTSFPAPCSPLTRSTRRIHCEKAKKTEKPMGFTILSDSTVRRAGAGSVQRCGRERFAGFRGTTRGRSSALTIVPVAAGIWIAGSAARRRVDRRAVVGGGSRMFEIQPIGESRAARSWTSGPRASAVQALFSRTDRTGSNLLISQGISSPSASSMQAARRRPCVTRGAGVAHFADSTGGRSPARRRAGFPSVRAAAGTLAAQPLHRLSTVARFDSSSPHRIAVRGNQERTR